MKTTDLLNSPLQEVRAFLNTEDFHGSSRIYDAIILNLIDRVLQLEEKGAAYDKLIDRCATLLPGGIE